VDRTRTAKALVCALPSPEQHAKMVFVHHQMALSALTIPMAARIILVAVVAVAARVRTPALAQARNPVDPQMAVVAARAQAPLRQERTVLSRYWDSTGQSVVVFLAQSSSLDISVDNVI
jgi:hypothetical protein